MDDSGTNPEAQGKGLLTEDATLDGMAPWRFEENGDGDERRASKAVTRDKIEVEDQGRSSDHDRYGKYQPKMELGYPYSEP